MKVLFKRTLLAITCGSALFLSACNDDDNWDNWNSNKSYVSESSYNLDSMSEASSVKVMTYNMPNVLGETKKATAMVFVPKTTRPAEGWKVVVWEHGTVGVGDSCAPSKNGFNPRFKNMAQSLLKEGYVVVAPDYEGLGTPGMHPYLNLKSEANSAIYAVKAYKDHYGSQINGQWMSVGQSQGGHASLATAELSNSDTNYRGAVAGAPASSLGYIISVVAPQAIRNLLLAGKVETAIDVYAELLAYAAYTTVGITAYEPRFNYREVFKDRSKLIVELAEGTTGENGSCLEDLKGKFITDIREYLNTNSGKTVLDYPGLIDNFQENSTVKKFLVDNQPATKKINTPVMIIQGKLDMAVPYQVTEKLQQDLKNMGTDVTFLLVDDQNHTGAIVAKNAELVAFIKKHMPITK
ncbi:alpha/beta hydrolase family protein [Acinetobacter bereziniae]|uniref:alpha/beta hydrolase family protein n=1 Tax=Acinetobacter bereziniae TaxID=106648 RepID=UPI00190160CB|nr:prolyl oligopeptidase family serine peptidase [Acinetobacter bereziniae]MBJ9908596.1 prolyl oligopeptidase family serine peptidase [Acinetobacter bereziniae]MBJ9929905.1 prolyl oligopeptidase family serine peptidase [Acinetobacter bereziniae]